MRVLHKGLRGLHEGTGGLHEGLGMVGGARECCTRGLASHSCCMRDWGCGAGGARGILHKGWGQFHARVAQQRCTWDGGCGLVVHSGVARGSG